MTRNMMRVITKPTVFPFVPKPIAAVSMESMMKAQMRAPPLSMPVTCA